MSRNQRIGLGRAGTLRGSALTEYVLIGSLIAIAAIGIILIFGADIRGLFAGSANALAGDESGELTTVPASGREDGQGKKSSGGLSLGGKVKGKLGQLEDDEKRISETSVGADYTLAEGSHELGKLGNDENNVRVGNLDYNATVGAKYDLQKGEASVGIQGNVEVSAVEANLGATLGDRDNQFVGVDAQGKALSAKAYLDAGLAVGKEGASAKVKAGGEANLVEGSVSTQGGFRIPKQVPLLGGAQVTFGGKLSGSIGASAEGHAEAQANKEGVRFSVGGELGLGPGAGFDIDIGIHFD